MRTGNPALGDNTFTAVGRVARAGEAMTIQGTANKAILLLLCVLVTASWIWSMNPQAVTPWVAVGAIAGFVVALVTIFKQTWAPVTAPLYALLEGLVIGGVFYHIEAQFPGIVIQAAALTLGTCLALLLAYKSRLIRATKTSNWAWWRPPAASRCFTSSPWSLAFLASRCRSCMATVGPVSALACS